MVLMNMLRTSAAATHAAARRSVMAHSRPALSAAFSTERPVTRNASFASWNDDDVAHFRKVLRPEAVLTDLDDTAPYNVDWLKKYKAQSQKQLVLKPKTTEEVSAILKYCNERRLPVVPQGGNTGLVGGSVPVFDEIVLSTSAMSSVIDFDAVSGILVCEAGCILENLDNYVAKQGYMMPLDLGAKGTCQIGGNVSANAGGLRLLRYGSLHGTVLGIEAVLADGTIVDCLSTMRKDNTGYDLKQLFIGSEGTLGVVTKVSVLTPPRSSSVNVAMLGCEDFEAVQRTFVEAKKHLGEVLSAVEFMDRQSLDMVLSQQDWHKDPLESSCPYYILIETSGSNSTHDMEKLEAFLEDAMGSGTVVDGTVAQDAAQARKLFSIREDITLALSSRGYVYKYDLSLPISQYYKIVEETREKVSSLGAEVVCFGHLGDCNLHLNISTLEYDEKVFNAIEPFVFEFTSKYRGSISAEHGIGTHKPSYLHLSKSENAITLMQQMKKMMDPNGILNPYKLGRGRQVQVLEAHAADHALRELVLCFALDRDKYVHVQVRGPAAAERADVGRRGAGRDVQVQLKVVAAAEVVLREFVARERRAARHELLEHPRRVLEVRDELEALAAELVVLGVAERPEQPLEVPLRVVLGVRLRVAQLGQQPVRHDARVVGIRQLDVEDEHERVRELLLAVLEHAVGASLLGARNVMSLVRRRHVPQVNVQQLAERRSTGDLHVVLHVVWTAHLDGARVRLGPHRTDRVAVDAERRVGERRHVLALHVHGLGHFGRLRGRVPLARRERLHVAMCARGRGAAQRVTRQGQGAREGEARARYGPMLARLAAARHEQAPRAVSAQAGAGRAADRGDRQAQRDHHGHREGDAASQEEVRARGRRAQRDGVQLIDRNDELCILYEKSNLREQALNEGEIGLTCKDQEIRMLKIQLADLQRQLENARRQLPGLPKLAQRVPDIQEDLRQEKDVTELLCHDLETPKNSKRWRPLDGDDPDEDQLAAKMAFLEERYNKKKEQLLEKELVLEEVTSLSNKLRVQATERRGETLELAKKVNDFQGKIKETTRKMMAVVSELSMYQATAMKLQQEKHDAMVDVEECARKLQQGLAPNEFCEHRLVCLQAQNLRDEEMRMMKQQMRASVAHAQNFPTQLTYTTAELRPNAYIPEELGIPKPYGQQAPFKPTQTGTTVRHIRMPPKRDIEI